jgi:guanylate kinase
LSESLHEVIVFAGPHGAGKDTVEGLFTATQPDAVRHVRYSSRAQAADEVQGQAYNFVSPQEFDDMVERDAFIDYARYPEGSSSMTRPH